MPKELTDFEGFYQKELQKPILLFSPTAEEQVGLFYFLEKNFN